MTQRVVATSRAVRAVREMGTMLNGSLATTIEQLRRCGTVLSTPGVWDGPMAAEFRSEWPRIESATTHMLRQFQTLQATVQRITGDIMHADSGALLRSPLRARPGGKVLVPRGYPVRQATRNWRSAARGGRG